MIHIEWAVFSVQFFSWIHNSTGILYSLQKAFCTNLPRSAIVSVACTLLTLYECAKPGRTVAVMAAGKAAGKRTQLCLP
jgi:hypothetical protein